jgi:hypothetical protein
MDSKLYKEYIIRYGNKISVLIQSKKDSLIYNLYDSENRFMKVIKKDELYSEIPNIIQDNNTVLILEFFDEILELSTVHYPKQTNLTLPPIFI